MSNPENARFQSFGTVSLFAICLIVLTALLGLGLGAHPPF